LTWIKNQRGQLSQWNDRRVDRGGCTRKLPFTLAEITAGGKARPECSDWIRDWTDFQPIDVITNDQIDQIGA
jgi:hypothetical protein